MQTIIGVFLIVFCLWSAFTNIRQLYHIGKLVGNIEQDGDGSSPREGTAALKEYNLSMLLTALGIGALGAYFLLVRDLTFAQMAGGFLVFLGYGAIIQSFRKHDSAAQATRYGVDPQDAGWGRAFSLIFGLALSGFGVYVLL